MNAKSDKLLTGAVIAGGLGLLGYAAYANRSRLYTTAASFADKASAVKGGIAEKAGSVVSLMTDMKNDVIARVTSKSPAALDVQSLREHLRDYSSDQFQAAMSNSATEQQWASFGTALFHDLQSVGVGDSRLCHDLELSTNNVYAMTPSDFAHLLAWTNRNHPDILVNLMRQHPHLLQ